MNTCRTKTIEQRQQIGVTVVRFVPGLRPRALIAEHLMCRVDLIAYHVREIDEVGFSEHE
ncbi:MAG: hypothetical protein ACHQU0_03830 [Candidatus Paceibacteria bacterium]